MAHLRVIIALFGQCTAWYAAAASGQEQTCTSEPDTAYYADSRSALQSAWQDGPQDHDEEGVPPQPEVHSTAVIENDLHQEVSKMSLAEAATGVVNSRAPATQVYSTKYCFFALNKLTGQKSSWGTYCGNGGGSEDFTGFTEVYTTIYAFFALNKVTGQGICWASHHFPNFGGDCAGKDFTGITDVYSTSDTFMALNKATGRAMCWGYPGDCSDKDFTGFTDIYTTDYAFMALNKATGQAICWGSQDSGGNCAGMDFTGVTDVYSNQRVFMALNKVTGKVQCWGKWAYGECVREDFTGVTDVYSTDDGFMALNKATGKAICMGRRWTDYPCKDKDFTGTTDVYTTSKAFMAFNKATGQAQCWGDPNFGATSQCNSMLEFYTGDRRMTDVYTTAGAFFALSKVTGQGLCFGNNYNYGADCLELLDKFKGTTDVYNNYLAFMALNKNDGEAMCWGHRNFGGNCKSMDFSLLKEEVTPAPTANPAPTPIQEVTPAPTPEPTPSPAPVPTQEPTPEPEYCQPHGELDSDPHNDMPLCANGDVTWSCSSRGSYRKQCPAIAPYMCAKKKCDGDQDYCCETDCGTPEGPYGGRRPECK